MGSNLKTSRYSDGKIIASGTKDRFFSKSAQEPAFVWYNNDSINEKEYGRLYKNIAVLLRKIYELQKRNIKEL